MNNIMYRRYLEDLINWVKDDYRKPLLIWGARQVGKTYLVKNLFAEEFFKKSYIYIDLNIETDICNFIKNGNKPEEVLKFITFKTGKEITKDVLLIFDEAQECLRLITLLKYFCQDFSYIPIIVTGSMVRMKLLLDSKEHMSQLFPIGKINELTIYPLDFDEYLYNKNKMLYNEVKQSFEKFEPLKKEIHELVLDVLDEFIYIGGMPEVVNVFLETNSILKARKILVDIYRNYLGDMEFYQISNESIIRTKKIYENIYASLEKESKNFSPSIVGDKLKNRDIRAPLDWLIYGFLIYRCLIIKERVTSPLKQDNESTFRLYLNDTGILSYQCKLKNYSYSFDNDNTLWGIVYENYVAIQLVTQGFPLFYWKGKNNSEFEFLIETKDGVIPIDVKKGKKGIYSLKEYKNHNKLKYVVKISRNNLGFDKDNNILTIPLYMASLFFRKIKNENFEIYNV